MPRKTKPWVPSKFWDNMRPTSHPVETIAQFDITFRQQKEWAEQAMDWYDSSATWIRDEAKTGW